MKKIYLPFLLVLSVQAFSQVKYYASVIDVDKNIVARGSFQAVADSSIILLVENTPMMISVRNIYSLVIEKNPSRLEFARVGTSLAAAGAQGLLTSQKDSSDTAVSKSPLLSSEVATGIVNSAASLIDQLLEEKNTVATFLIDTSEEKFQSKKELLEVYSSDEEIHPEKKKEQDVVRFPATAMPPKRKPPVKVIVDPVRTGAPRQVVSPTKKWNQPKPIRIVATSTKSSTH